MSQPDRIPGNTNGHVPSMKGTGAINKPAMGAMGQPASSGYSKVQGFQHYLEFLQSQRQKAFAPLSFAQQRIWLSSQLKPDSALYAMPLALRLKGELRVDILERSLREIVRRHESLRTVFKIQESTPVQAVMATTAPVLQLVDLRALISVAREQAAQQLSQQEVQHPFALESGPLMRVKLFMLDSHDYLLILTLHHIVIDGGSRGLLLQELQALYMAFSNGLPSPLPELQTRYIDYTLWQRQRVQGELLERQLAYWKRQLGGALPALDLPTLRSRPALQTYAGAHLSIQVPPTLLQQVEAFSQREGVTVFTTLLAAFQVLLARYSQQSEVVVGTAVSGRGPAEIEPLLGCFINMLALRTDLSGKLSWQDVLQRVRKVCRDAYRHQDVPFEQVVEALRPERDPSRTPLFQVMFVQQQETWSQIDLPGITMQEQDVENSISPYDLTCLITDSGRGQIEYNSDLFDEQMMQSMVQHWYRLLASLVTQPQQYIAEVSLLTEAEQKQMLVEWNATQKPELRGHCLHELFAQQATRSPDTIALVASELSLSYSALNRLADQVAHFLQQQGVEAETPVGLLLERVPLLLLSLLGILKAGGTVVPLDPGAPQERLLAQLKQAEVRLVLTTQPLEKRLPGEPVRALCLDAHWSHLPAPSAVAAVCKHPQQVAYLISTSGSTGTPKGVLGLHQGAANNILASMQTMGIQPGDRLTQCASFSFDLSLLEVFQAWLAGATLCQIPSAVLASSSDLVALLRREALTMLGLPPSLLQMLPETELPDLRMVLVGGERCPDDVMRRWGAGRDFFIGYGPTETAIQATLEQGIVSQEQGAPLGRALPNVQTYVLDEQGQPVPIGVVGELYIGGEVLARGYVGRGDLTAERFVPHPFSRDPGQRLYRTGDLVRWQQDGHLTFVGRQDGQVKLRGQRIELGEIDAAMRKHPAIKDVAVLLKADERGEQRLVAYAAVEQPASPPETSMLRQYLQEWLSLTMIPTAFVWLEALPLTSNGKIDQRALLALPVQQPVQHTLLPPSNELERLLAQLWQEHLHIAEVDVNTNFFDLGGHSLLMAQIRNVLHEKYQRDVALVDMFKYNTIASLARFLGQGDARKRSATTPGIAAAQAPSQLHTASSDIAIIGLACRFPGASNAEAFWQNIREGRETISHFSDEELLAAGLDPATLNDPAYVRANAVLDDIELFDAGFFGYSPREAEILDPQQRLFLECSEEALENAGYDTRTYADRIGVYAGSSVSTYLLYNLAPRLNPQSALDMYQEITANDKDFLATRVAYKLNLRGPALTVQSACSTSLVALHLACQALLNGDCEMALAGAAAVRVPQKLGYTYQQGSIASPDGHCRAFDEQAQGTVFGNGVGAVVLKRLDQALADGDTIHAVIKGTAINNDGADKVGYTAPGIAGQAQVIRAAQAKAGVDPESISYIEAHGTGTPIGDPIEVAALVEAFGTLERKQFCALGSVKTNIGHLDVAAGLAGLLKTVFALKQRELPPSLHFSAPNPALSLDESPFYVNTTLQPWQSETPRRAGVSSFGIGGTNAHIILEEAPEQPASQSPAPRSWQTLVLSARSATALEESRMNLLRHLQSHPDLKLADVAYTLQVGRPLWKHRQVLVCRDEADALEALADEHSPRLLRATVEQKERQVAFLFPGQGSQYMGMGADLYQHEEFFRNEVKRCLTILEGQGIDLRPVLLPEPETLPRDGEPAPIDQTWLTQPALFVVEYALARLWISWGISPAALIGHSIGEYVAACLADVFSLEDALKLVAARGKLMQGLPGGAMLAVALPEQEILPRLSEQLSLAVINAPNQSVIAGPEQAIELLEQQLRAEGLQCRRLRTSHAFHSLMVEPMMADFAALVRSIPLREPQLPYISNITGTWISAAEATDPAYWVRHLRYTVRFSSGLQELLRDPGRVLLEVGPGHTLSRLAQAQVAEGKRGSHVIIASLPAKQPSESFSVYTALGRLWLAGCQLTWERLYAGERRLHVPLPAYPFERQRYWVEALPRNISAVSPLPTSEPRSVALGEVVPEQEAVTFYSRPEVQTEYVAPRNDEERALAAIWQELLGIERIGVYDNFFELGGHSLMSTQVAARIRSVMHLDLPLRDVFEATTLAELAECTLLARKDQEFRRLVPQPRSGPLPLSFAQQRLWFLEQLDASQAIYNLFSAIELSGLSNIEQIVRSLREIVRRHEALRTSISVVDGAPVQVIAPDVTLDIPVIDLRAVSHAERFAEIQRLSTLEAQRRFDLSQHPLMRVSLLLSGAPQEQILLLNLHHSIADGWSMTNLLREFAALYTAFVAGQPSPLPELALQYVDYALWQRQHIQHEALDRQLAYWKRQLGGTLPVLNLPTTYPRPATQTYRGAHLPVQLPATLMEQVRALSVREGVTIFMILLTAFQALLARYSDQDEIIVGTPVAGRGLAELEPLIGCFINTLALRTDLSGEPTWRELLQRVRTVCLEAYEHQELPFEQVVDALQPERNLSRTPLFQVMFTSQEAAWFDVEMRRGAIDKPATGAINKPAIGAMPVSLRHLPIEGGTSPFDITWSVTDAGSGRIEYNTDLFDNDTIQRMLRHFQILLEIIVTTPEQHISAQPLLTAAERTQLLFSWNNVEQWSPQERCLHELFEEQVALAPDALALVCEEQQVTYAQLNSRANQLAHYLRGQAVGPEVLVGLCMERSVELIVAILGILKAGGAYVPLDPSYPQERMSFMLSDARVRLLLTQQSLLEQVPAQERKLDYEAQQDYEARPYPSNEVQAVCLDSAWPLIAQEPQYNLHGTMNVAEQTAYVIYTSGSTGRPKGVMIPHANVARLFVVAQDDFHFDGRDVWTLFHSSAFDFSVWELWGALLYGGRLVVVPYILSRSPENFATLLQTHGVTILNQTPSAFRQLVQVREEKIPGLALRRVIFGGEALDAQSVRIWLERYGEQYPQLVNMYGITETTVHVTFCPLSLQDVQQATGTPIGRPLADLQAYVLDQHQQPVPIGVPGELYIGGAGLARGYLQRAALTAERFIPHSFSSQVGARLYKTGDQARFLPTGTLEYLGRIDQQVKIRGFRIELGEIETLLTLHPDIRSCVVLLREDTPGDQRLVAYVVAAGAAPTREALRHYLQEKLPEYMVPTAFVFLEALPLTSNGKVDRRALPTPIAQEVAHEAYVAAPHDIVEEVILEQWAQILGVEHLGLYDNFFRLGGHSLLATVVVARLRQTLGVELPLRTLFEAPDVATFAERVREELRSDHGVARPPLVKRQQTGDAVPLSFAQQRLWFLNYLEDSAATYNIPLVVRIVGTLQKEALWRGLMTVVQRHESLRTTIRSAEGEATQHILASVAAVLPLIDLRSLPVEQREAVALHLAQQEALRPFALSEGILWRARLLCLDDTTHFFLLTTHHIISDAWSHSILIRELAAGYNAYSSGKRPDLPALPLQYADYTLWQRQWLRDEVLEQQLAYWSTQLAELTPLELPTDHPRPPVQRYRGRQQAFSLSKALSAQLKVLGQREGVTLFMILLAAFQVLLMRYSGQEDIVVGSPVANRTQAEIEDLIGFFVNTLVLRTDLTGNPSWHEVLQRVKEVCLGAYAHQEVPFEQIVEVLQPVRDLSRAPLFQVMFVLQNTPFEQLALRDLDLDLVQLSGNLSKFDLTIELQETPQGLSGGIEYNTDIFEAATIQRLLDHWQILLEAVVAQPEQRVGDVPMLTAQEQRQLLLEWNVTADETALQGSLQHSFERQVESVPEHIAVVAGAEQLTYGELNRRVNRLAWYLRAQGVGPDVLVGLCLSRSVDLILAVLAVHKAGGAYVPLDPGYPQERLAFMLKDAGVHLLLTQRQHQHLLAGQGAQVIYLNHNEQSGSLDQDKQITGRSDLSAHQALFPDKNPERQVQPDNLAYIIYTSGSTGVPKGAMITQGGLTNYLRYGMQSYIDADMGGAPLHSSIGFDLTVTSLFLPLVAGQRVVICPEEEGVEALGETLRNEGSFSLLKITPAHLEVLNQRLDGQMGRINTLVIGGEALFGPMLLPWQRLMPETRIINEYGPTETVVGCVIYELQRVENCPAAVPIGRPLANTQVYVLNKYWQPVPVGVPGELYIGGAGVARGYWQRPDLTAERFIPNSSGQPGSRLYRTGDLVRYRPDGVLEYLGRLDEQVKVKGYRIELGEIEAAVRRYPAVRECVVILREDRTALKRLVAYVVAEEQDEVLVQNLRTHLKETLPDYMVPAHFVVLDALPLTRHGKVDRRTLPAPDEERAEENYVAPRTPIEEALAHIWEDMLGVEHIGIHDNFFGLGGDSILSIRIIARASQVGLHLTVKQLFQHQTIAELSEQATGAISVQADQSAVRGPVHLTPIQRWFFSQPRFDPHHFNQYMYLDVHAPLEHTLLRRALASLLLHHDALRLRFTRDQDAWLQTSADPDNTAVSLVQLDLTACTPGEQEHLMQQIEQAAQRAVNLTSGPLLHVIYIQLGGKRRDMLLISIHHLVVDGISWQVLLEDLQNCYQQLKRGQSVLLPPKTTSYQQWAEHLLAYSQTEKLLLEQAYWLAGPWQQVQPLPLDLAPDGEQNLVATQQTVAAALSAEETHALLGQVPLAYQAEILEVLLTALAQSTTSWSNAPAFLVDIERHGREDLFEGVNVARTVGWFTSLFPLCVDLMGAATRSDLLQAIQQRLRQMPERGIGYGILRYLSAAHDTARALPQAEILFNYLGQFDQVLNTSELFSWSDQAAGLSQSPHERRSHLFEINCLVREGQFQVFWSYSASLHKRETVERLAQAFIEALRAFVAGSQAIRAGGYIPADFPSLYLNAEEMKHILAEVGIGEQAEIESIAPLSPVQQGMFYETMSHPDTEIHVEQLICTFTGNLEGAAFERAWQWIIDRHSIFRTAFSWDAYAEPLQVILKHAVVPFRYHDWRNLAPDEQAQALARHLAAERKACVLLTHAPVMRVTVFQMEDERYEFAWTTHHLLVDGWSSPIVIKEVLTCYQALRLGQQPALERSRPYRDYVAWLMQTSDASAERFWRTYLEDFRQATPLGREINASSEAVPEEHYGSQQRYLPASVTTRLRGTARQRRLTLNTLLQGSWALLLSRYSERHDVVFGMTVSGRPAEIEGIDTLIGPCINTIPLRVALPSEADARVWPWLAQVQNSNLELQSYEHTPGGTIHQWSDLPAGQALYESLLVLENLSADLSLLEDGSLQIKATNARFVGAQTRHALTLLITPGDELEVKAIYDTSRLKPDAVQLLLQHFTQVLERLAEESEDLTLAGLRSLVPAEQVPQVYTRRSEPQERHTSSSISVPRNELEELLLLTWREVLGLANVGIHDNFFALGGHSLLATLLVTRLRGKLRMEIPLRALFEAPTISSLAARLQQQMLQGQGDVIPPIIPVSREQELPLSFAQQRLWFLHQLAPESSAYHIPIVVRLAGKLDLRALRESFFALVQRHESLRTTFEEDAGQPVQRIATQMPLALPLIDLRAYHTARREAQVQLLARQEAQRTFDLKRGPLWRVSLLRLGATEHVLLLTMHHIISDGWSMGVFINDLAPLYRAFASGEAFPLAPLPVQYADYAVWQRRWLQGEVLKEQLRYWTYQLSEAHSLELPTDYPRTAALSTRGARYNLPLEPELVQALEQLSRQEGVTLFMTLLTAFQVLLSRMSREQDVVVGTDSANRAHLETEGLIGFFVNLLALRTRIAGKRPFRELLSEVREMVLGAYMHQELPFEMIVEHLRLSRTSQRTPLVNVLFVMQNIPMNNAELAGLTTTILDTGTTTAKFDLALFVTDEPAGLNCSVNYSTDLFAEASIEKMLQHYTVLLHNIVAHPAASIDSLEMFSEEEKQVQSVQKKKSLKRHLSKLKDFKDDLINLS